RRAFSPACSGGNRSDSRMCSSGCRLPRWSNGRSLSLLPVPGPKRPCPRCVLPRFTTAPPPLARRCRRRPEDVACSVGQSHRRRQRVTGIASDLPIASIRPSNDAPVKPRARRPGSRIALIAPAGPLPEGAIERAERRVRELGWEPLTARHARARRGYLAGTDRERLADLEDAIESPENDGIWCLRGGYGTMRLLAD